MNQHESSRTGPLPDCRATSRGSVLAVMRRVVSQARIFAARKEAQFSGTAIPAFVAFFRSLLDDTAVKTEPNRAPVTPLDAEEK